MKGRVLLTSIGISTAALVAAGCKFSVLKSAANTASDTSAQEKNCISRHVRDAIALNSKRAPLYAAASDGRTRMISRELITMERTTLASLPTLELPALRFQKAGVPVLCLDVVSMSGVPEFVGKIEPPKDPFQRFDGMTLSQELMRSRVGGDEKTLEVQLDAALTMLNKNPRYNCLTRHIVESVLRSVRLAPIYRKMCIERGLPEPNVLIGTYINAQIGLLGVASLIDSQAAPLHREGIPIVCNDVPVTPTDVENVLSAESQPL